MNKLLLYCTKAKPYLKSHSEYEYNEKGAIPETRKRVFTLWQDKCDYYNGKIVAECDFEVEEIFMGFNFDGSYYGYRGLNTTTPQLYKQSCMYNFEDFEKYLGINNGYAIHIKNLHIFDAPKELSNYCYAVYPNTSKVVDEFRCNEYSSITDMYECDKAPQNMARVFTWDWNSGKSDDTYVLISIHPEHLCKILNGEKTIEVRKKVLKEML